MHERFSELGWTCFEARRQTQISWPAPSGNDLVTSNGAGQSDITDRFLTAQAIAMTNLES